MGDIVYEFVHLDSDETFFKLGRTFGGVLQNLTIKFDNDIVKGELTKWEPEEGLWIRKWTFTTYQQIMMRKLADTNATEKKYSLVYLLNPSLFTLKRNTKKVSITGRHNSLFFSNNLTMDFSVVPKQPFYCLNIAFTDTWLLKQFNDADQDFKTALNEYLDRSSKTVLLEPCCINEYKTLHGLETCLQGTEEDILFIRSNVYGLIADFFGKMFNQHHEGVVPNAVNYSQIMKVEKMIAADILKPPKVEFLSKEVNMSVSSLLRQFKLIFKKSIQEYCVEKKMDLAKTLVLKSGVKVKEMAKLFGYKQVSSFIDTFTKRHGCSPGSFRSLEK